MDRRKNLIIALILNLTVVIFEIIGLVLSIQDYGLRLFQFYTQDSNIIAGAACAILAVWQALRLFGKSEKPPEWVRVLKYISVCLLSVTFLVVIFVLAPTVGFPDGYVVMLFRGTMLYHHLLCPVLVFVSFVFFEHGGEITRKHAALAMVPTFLYAVIAILLNIMRIMEGPYPFLMVYEQPVFMSAVWFAAILGGAYLIALMIRFLFNKTNSRKEEN